MAIPLNVDGTPYPYPQQGDVGYASSATAWAQAVTTAVANAEANITTLGDRPFASYTSATTSCTTGVATVVNFPTKEQDTDNAVTTGAAWKFTVPVGKGGVYRISTMVTFSTVNPAANSQFTARVYKNNVSTKQLGQMFFTGGTGFFPGLCGSVDIQLTAGDFVDIRIIQTLAATLALNASAVENWVTIKRLV